MEDDQKCNESVRSIMSLEGLPFSVPAYQRNFRWQGEEVQNFIQDIADYSINRPDNEDDFYCIQPFMLQYDSISYLWKILDGQQRLTTIFLIYRALTGLSLFTIKYETRKGSDEFIENIDKKTDEDANKYIDYFNMYNAYHLIKKYIDNFDKEKYEKFEECFLSHVKFIWYAVEEKEKDEDVFERSNIGKIPLTNAELIKALFLAKSNNQDSKLVDRAKFWYQMENRLRDNKDKIYCLFRNIDDKLIEFKSKNGNVSSIIGDDTARVELILETLNDFAPKNDKMVLFNHYYKIFKDTPQSIDTPQFIDAEWIKFKECGNQLYNFGVINEESDQQRRNVYHLIGFLIQSGTCSSSHVWKIWDEDRNIDRFATKLLNLIKIHFEHTDLEDLQYINDNDRKKIFALLLLFNLDIMTSSAASRVMFPFNSFKMEKWSLEHIHAQNAKLFRNKSNDIIINYLQDIRKSYECDKNKKAIVDKITALLEKQNFDTPAADTVYREIENDFESEMHKISNLAILDKNSNTQLRNGTFREKRKKVLELDQQHVLIPRATGEVFNKVYSTNKVNGCNDIWLQEDRDDYLEKISTQLKKYLGASNE